MGRKKKTSIVEVCNKERKAILSAEETKELTKYMFPFENIVFEGGGSKGSAYIGSIRVLEEMGVWSNIQRFGGASSGALMALIAALGYDSYEIEKIFQLASAKVVFDARFGKLSLIPNIRKLYGWHPGKRMLKFLGTVVEEKLGDPDATFADLYFKSGKELAVIVTNVNQLDCVYCHVKTTPHMPIRLAVRMSSSIPGVLAPVKYALHGTEELYCDGGLTCNYPIHVFDGWYLSLKPEDNFLKKIPDLQDVAAVWDVTSRFGCEPNRKTIGLLLYSDNEQEIFKVQLDERIEKYTTTPNSWPRTKKAKAQHKADKERDTIDDKHDQIMEAMFDFMKLLPEYDSNDSGTISREEFKAVLEQFEDDPKTLLFGADISADELFDSFDRDGDGEITVFELITYAEQHGIQLRKLFRGFAGREIKSLSNYVDCVIETMLLNLKRIYMRGGDLYRTVGINTEYLETLDFDMEPADKEFATQQGKVACIAFLRHHMYVKELSERREQSEDHTPIRKQRPRTQERKFFSIKKRRISPWSNPFKKQNSREEVQVPEEVKEEEGPTPQASPRSSREERRRSREERRRSSKRKRRRPPFAKEGNINPIFELNEENSTTAEVKAETNHKVESVQNADIQKPSLKETD